MSSQRSASGVGCLAGVAMLLAAGLVPAADSAAPAVERRQLQANDVDGKAVKVPQADRASVLVFLMAEQPQSQKVIEQLTGVLGPNPAVQVVAVISGQQARALADSLKGKLRGPVVIDPEYAIAGKMSVRAWPTTLVILPSGEEAAHLAGLAKSYTKDLAAYLDFAGGKIDRQALTRRRSANTRRTGPAIASRVTKRSRRWRRRWAAPPCAASATPNTSPPLRRIGCTVRRRWGSVRCATVRTSRSSPRC